jgi:hypothetical protein
MVKDYIIGAGIDPPFPAQPHHGPIELCDYAANNPLKNTYHENGTPSIRKEQSLKFGLLYWG